MSSGFFGVLRGSDDDSSSEENEEDSSSNRGGTQHHYQHQQQQHHHQQRGGKRNSPPPPQPLPSQSTTTTAFVHIPSYEDLSTVRTDELTVLEAVYGDEFTSRNGVWGCKVLQVHVRPPDVEPSRVGSHLILAVQLSKQYPYVVPSIELKEVKGLSHDETLELHKLLRVRAEELAETGSVMMIELVQVAEDFLLAHNVDPTMSAWEQMKAREAAQQQQAMELEEEMTRLMSSAAPSSLTSPKFSSNTRVTFRDDSEVRMFDESDHQKQNHASGHDVAIERELMRQQGAFEAAKRLRLDGTTAALKREPLDTQEAFLGESEEGDDEDVDYELDDSAALALSGSSRYKSDFIELGVLGRGGGGEVVKVRNRLDRRIYAVKKIVLDSEEGRFAKVGALQNRKLRREVTTISRMTHKNIVRYYQAWVEGGTKLEAKSLAFEDSIKAEGKESCRKAKDSGSNPSSSESEIDNDESETNGGWWTNSPMEHDLPAQMQPGGRNVLAASSFDPFDEGSDASDPIDSSGRLQSRQSDSMVDFLENKDNDHDFHSPLLNGLGFQNHLYDGLFPGERRISADKSAETESEEDWDESSVHVDSTSGRAILYIQMEYCASTLRKLIDDHECAKMQKNDIWRLVRQILEALVYIHRRNIIHRDLKPSNIFIDSESQVKLGDFGLATTHRNKNEEDEEESGRELDTLEEFYGIGDEDMSSRVGGTSSSARMSLHSATGESMTGGVGTTFYIAPEQEAKGPKVKGESFNYTLKADIFSFGVILFEIFYPPFDTYMERAETLTTLRADHDPGSASAAPPKGWWDADKNDFDQFARRRFPAAFVASVPENAQRMILWCLERNPSKRPTAEDLLASELLPRKIELEQHYLDEAMEILITSSQSESYQKIVDALFNRPNSDMVEFTFDTDIAARSNLMLSGEGAMELLRAMGAIRAGALDLATLSSITMSSSSIVASTASFKRSRNAGQLGKGGKGMLKRATQRTAGILAMRAAAAAAVTGALDGVHGADPLVVERLLELCKNIFRMHGAVRLRSPLLRPRADAKSNAVGGPAELINSRGVVLLLPEDLTAPFARALGRGGSATSNLKRYDIGRVFHKSMADGHPRESLEASFDVVQENTAFGYLCEAETIIVASQVMALLPRRHLSLFTFESYTPLWYLRVNHTRLADALLDLCGVPPKDATRRVCFQVLSRFTAPPPHLLKKYLASKKKSTSSSASRRSSSLDGDSMQELSSLLGAAVAEHGLPKPAAEKLRVFIESCFPLPLDLDHAVENLKKSITMIRGNDPSAVDPRRSKRFEDAAKSLRSIRDVFSVLQALRFEPHISRQQKQFSSTSSLSYPLFTSLDLGLRQRRKHYHGGFVFQCIALPDTFFDQLDPAEHNEALISSSGRGTKVAEGGNFSELVRKHRPPGNFGTAFISFYTAAPIPACCGVRISVGKLVELIYLDAASIVQRATLDGWNELLQKSSIDKPGLEVLRQSLGHPLQYAESIQCIVCSVHGMDAATTKERFVVASRLWQEGISAEYLPQGGVMLSLLRRLRDHSSSMTEENSDWSLAELVGVCALLNIPFLVIVQPHLFRDKGSVRLRRYPFDVISQVGSAGNPSSGGSSSSEVIVALDDLASTILGGMPEQGADEIGEVLAASGGQSTSFRDILSRSGRDMPCILVDHDQYYGNDRELFRSDLYVPQWKAYLKSMKSISLSAQNYLGSLQDATTATGRPPAVFAVMTDISFFVLRDFGTTLMKREVADKSALGASNEMIERYPKHKRVLKTLGQAIDSFMKRQGFWVASTTTGISGSNNANNHHHHHHKQQQQQQQVHQGPSSLVSLLLYSKVDDRFDLVTLSCANRNLAGTTTTPTTKKGK